MTKDELAQKLQDARTHRQASLQDAARVLSIRPQVLQDLEDGHYERLGSLLYIKNYVKKYSDYLKIDRCEIEPLLAQLEDPFKVGKNESLIRAQLNEDKRMVQRSFFKWYSIILFAIFGTGIAIYFIYGEKAADIFHIKPTPDKIINAQTNIVLDDSNEDMTDDSTISDSEITTSVMQPSSTPSMVMKDDSVNSIIAGIVPNIDTKSTLSEFEVEQIIRDGKFNLASTPSDVAMTEDAIAQENLPLPEGISALSITLNGSECWIQIKDKNHKVLMSEVLPANATYHLEGAAPFSLHIGNAQSIDKLMLNGEVVDEKIYRPTAKTTVSKIKLMPKEENKS